VDVQPGPFIRLFDLPPAPADDELAQAIGIAFGPMQSSSGQGGNPAISAGFTYLGQFIDHDLSFDPETSLDPGKNTGIPRNFRTAAFDLDSIYGLGPDVMPYLYDPHDPRKFVLGGSGDDLPRLGDVAVISDPRNDENIIVSQLATAFLNFHNVVIERENKSFEETQLLVRQHYQWIVLQEYLPRIVGSPVDQVVEDTMERGYPDRPSIPLEFSLAAFRFGHSQIRERYDINSRPEAKARLILPDLVGHRRLTAIDHVDWSFFFPMETENQPQPSMPIQPFISGPMLNMPPEILGPTTSEAELSVAYRDIRRGQILGLPEPEALAEKLKLTGSKMISRRLIWDQVRERLKRAGATFDPGDRPVPLWLYILFEAQELAQGEHLGPMAARIVSDVFVSLLLADPQSVLSVPNWKPTLGTNGSFGIADLLRMSAR
jgi:Animal haem peroxidase